MEVSIEALRAALSSGGDFATILVAYGIWRLERRVTILETIVKK